MFEIRFEICEFYLKFGSNLMAQICRRAMAPREAEAEEWLQGGAGRRARESSDQQRGILVPTKIQHMKNGSDELCNVHSGICMIRVRL